jgi:hypothetical protein
MGAAHLLAAAKKVCGFLNFAKTTLAQREGCWNCMQYDKFCVFMMGLDTIYDVS